MTKQDKQMLYNRMVAEAEKARQDMLREKREAVKRPGTFFEKSLTNMFQIFTQNMAIENDKKPIRVRNGAVYDIMFGTDVILEDPAGAGLSSRSMRIDATINFGGKDFMPLVTPEKDDILRNPAGWSKRENAPKQCPYNRGIVPIGNGNYARFGIRIGCGAQGYGQPVLVIGLCSDHALDGEGVFNASRDLYQDFVKHAHDIMFTADRVMCRFRYMTDKAYRDCINSMHTADEIREELPILVYNPDFITTEYGYLEKRQAQGNPHTCTATMVTPDGDVTRDHDGYEIRYRTDIPWLSTSGKTAIAAMKNTPMKLADGMAEKIDALLSEPAREPNVEPPIVVDEQGNTLDGKTRTSAMLQVAWSLRKQYRNGKQNGNGGRSY